MRKKEGISICVVGGGSSYTPELVDGLLQQDPAALPVRELRFTDPNAERLAIMAGFTERAVGRAGREVRVLSDVRLAPMAEGVDFVITQVRVGGMKARHLDESIPLKYGLIGQETTGAGGMFKALRTIPHLVEMGRVVAEVAPSAVVLNYTNPSGIIAEAVSKYTGATILGLCSGVPGMQRDLRRRFAERYPDLRLYTVGTNHFGHIYRATSGGREVTVELIEALARQIEGDGSDAEARSRADLVRLLQAYPISYVNYFYHRGRMVAHQQARPMTRAQEIESIEREVLAEAADPQATTKPAALSKRGGGGYSGITFSVLKAILNDTGEEIVCNVPNRGTVEGIEDDAVVEVVCRVDGAGAHPLPVGPIPLAFRGVMQSIKAYETLTVEAAMQRSRRLATLALLNHPLLGDLETIVPLLDEMLAAHGLEFE
jgi:6-phospho-beta-glucosidase